LRERRKNYLFQGEKKKILANRQGGDHLPVIGKEKWNLPLRAKGKGGKNAYVTRVGYLVGSFVFLKDN